MVAKTNLQKDLKGNDSFLLGLEGSDGDKDLATDEESCFSSSDASYEDHHQRSFQQLSAQLHFRSPQQPQSCMFEGTHLLPSFCGLQFPVERDSNTKMQQNCCTNNNENMYCASIAGDAFRLRSCGNSNKQSKKKRITKTVYVPHKNKPPQVVDKRNARERRRVEAVNDAFKRLRKIIPYENRNKRLSKFKTLKIAINYIRNLQDLVRGEAEQGSVPECPAPVQWSCDLRPEIGHNMMTEYKYSGSHDFGYDSHQVMHQYPVTNGTICGQYQTLHPTYSSTSPVGMEMSNSVAMDVSTSCNRWTGPQVQLSPHGSVYHQHL